MGGQGRVRGDTGRGIVGGTVGTSVWIDAPVQAEPVANYVDCGKGHCNGTKLLMQRQTVEA